MQINQELNLLQCVLRQVCAGHEHSERDDKVAGVRKALTLWIQGLPIAADLIPILLLALNLLELGSSGVAEQVQEGMILSVLILGILRIIS